MYQNFELDDKDLPVVSICCLVYNHEEYLVQALDSFLMQKTTFPIEIVIHDDASTDNSAAIIKGYALKHPKLFKPLYQTENQKSRVKSGMNPRFNFPRAKGKYIALCDGDDYWTDPLKLQKQVDFLEENNEYFFVSANSESHVSNRLTKSNISSDIIIDDFVLGNKLGRNTSAYLFRNKKLDEFCDYLEKDLWPFGDLLLGFWCLQYGKGFVLGDVMLYYRIHDQGIWSSICQQQRITNFILFYSLLYKSDVNRDYDFTRFKRSIDWVLKTFNSTSSHDNKKIFKKDLLTFKDFNPKKIVRKFKNRKW